MATYLAFVLSKFSARNNTMCTWENGIDRLRGSFQRQAMPMTWDFAEANPLEDFGGGFGSVVESECEVLEGLPEARLVGQATQEDAAARDYAGVVMSTDPPYYDNIGYSDLSDFFYVWLRRTLRDIHPGLFASMLVPKAEEHVANPYRHGRDGAERFFEEGFERVFARARLHAPQDFPITVYYAFKQAELELEGIASTGWATILEGMIREGWAITATWPVRTEMASRMIASGTNALASSIVLVLRPRHETAGQTTRRGFLAALKRELPSALEEMRQGRIAPVDLAQATIGPGMAVFSRFHRVVENDGSDMSVKTALALINQVLDEVLAEQDDLDADTRFCVKWYEQFGWSKAPFGDADVLARAYNTSVRGLADGGVLTQGDGVVQLIRPQDLPIGWNPLTDHRISVWEVACSWRGSCQRRTVASSRLRGSGSNGHSFGGGRRVGSAVGVPPVRDDTEGSPGRCASLRLARWFVDGVDRDRRWRSATAGGSG